jgi:hypothetical protein
VLISNLLRAESIDEMQCRITDLFDHPKRRRQRSAIRSTSLMDGSQIVPGTKLKFRDLWRISRRAESDLDLVTAVYVN